MKFDKKDGFDELNKCLTCGVETQAWGQIGNYQISVCPKCGMGITDNPTLQESSYHRDGIYEKENSQFRNIFQRRINLIESLKMKKGKALEVGSSTGLLLSLLQEKGWDVTGVEISTEAAEYAEKRGVQTIKTSIEKINFPQNSLDLIVINHTLEHLQNPIEVLQKLFNLLKSGGVLLIDVPNFGGLSAKTFKTSWFALLPEEHLWHFTYLSLSKLLQSLGFKIIKHESVSGIWDYGSPVKEILQSFSGIKKRFFSNVLTALPNFFVTKFDQGATLTILAQK